MSEATVPMNSEATVPVNAEATAPHLAGLDARVVGPARILIVDDELAIRDKEFGEHALEKFPTNAFMDGLDRHAREQPARYT